MTRTLPTALTALQMALAGAATYLLCSTDLLNNAVFFIH